MMISNEHGQSVNENLSKKELNKQSHDLTERVKELHCIYSFGILIDTQDISMEGILQGSVDLIPPAWLYSDITCARITAYGMESTTRKFKKTDWQQSSDIIVHNKCIGKLEVYYLAEKPTLHEGPFSKEERGLLDAITERLGKVFERKQSEKKSWKAKKNIGNSWKMQTAILYVGCPTVP